MRHADTKGYAYCREDVDARSLANAYAQLIGQVFTHDMKPMEVEILVAEVGASDTDGSGDQLYHILYDGTVFDEDRFTVLGGEAEAIQGRMESSFQPAMGLADAVKAATAALAGPERTLGTGDLEVAVLDRRQDRRAFRRIDNDELQSLLNP